MDEHKQHILTNYQNLKNGGKVFDTDHCTEYIDLNMEIVSHKPERREIFNFKEKEGQLKFKTITSEKKFSLHVLRMIYLCNNK